MSLTKNEVLFAVLTFGLPDMLNRHISEIDMKYIEFLLDSTKDLADDVAARLNAKYGTENVESDYARIAVEILIDTLRAVDSELKAEGAGDESRSV